MKKVLSVAMASAMVLGMGANAFAIQYSTGSNETASWPKNFGFEGSLFVTDKDGNIVESTLTDLNGKTSVDFQPGDVIWMPLYADNQKVYTVTGANTDGKDEVAASTIELKGVENAVNNGEVAIDTNGNVLPFSYTDEYNKVVYWYGNKVEKTDYRSVELKNGDFKTYLNGKSASGSDLVQYQVTSADITVDPTVDVKSTANGSTSDIKDADTVEIDSVSFQNGINGVSVSVVASSATAGTVKVRIPMAEARKANTFDSALKASANEVVTPASYVEMEIAVSNVSSGTFTDTDPTGVVIGSKDTTSTSVKEVKDGVTVKVNLPKVAAVEENAGTIKPDYNNSVNVSDTVVSHGHYTGNIDKNWSINLIEEDNGVADLIEKAELYKATAVDYTSYSEYTEEIQPNAVYLKVTLKDNWKLADDANLKYYVYVADNKSNTNVTNKVWVSGKYAASYRYVDFTWTNDASKAGLWKVKDGENGVAVFDFADKAFFQVKMYSKESMYLDLSTAYDKAIAGDFSEADSFFKFDNENANFSRTGTLILVSDDASLIPYQVTENGYTKVDAQYVEDFAIAHTNEKVNGFVFETKELGNYVLATEEVAEEEDNNTSDNTQEVVVPDTDNNETNNNSKPNPSTGAEDFVGLAVSLAVVSVAAAGALALKK